MGSEDNFKCNLCNNAYRYQGTLKTHIMVEHCKSHSYNCNQCEYHTPSIDFGVSTQSFKTSSMGIKSDGGPDGPDGLMPLESKSSIQMQIQIDMRLTGAKADLKNIVAKVIFCAVKEPKTQRSPDVISLKRCEVLDKVREIEQGITQKTHGWPTGRNSYQTLKTRDCRRNFSFPNMWT